MPTIHEHDLHSYLREIQQVKENMKGAFAQQRNLTSYYLGVRNRANLILVGLCSLVELLMTQIGAERSTDSSAGKKSEQNLNGGKSWDGFENLRAIRNAIVYGYGGILEVGDLKKLHASLEKLKWDDCFVAERRITLTTDALTSAHEIMSALIREAEDLWAQLSNTDESGNC